MITNHYGHTVDSEIPTTGVLGINQINSQVLNDCMFYEGGINLDSLDRVDNYLIEHGLSELDDTSRLALMDDLDWNEDSPDDTWIIGDWIKDEHGQYEPDKTGEYSAIVRESTIQVVWSIHIIRVQFLCSPCYPGQCDIHVDDEGDYITSDTGFLCYNLPDEFYDNDY